MGEAKEAASTGKKKRKTDDAKRNNSPRDTLKDTWKKERETGGLKGGPA